MHEYIALDIACQLLEQKRELFFDKVDSDIAIAIIARTPLASLVDLSEVVYCKDCKYWNHGDCFRLELSLPYDYCSYAKRKDGAGDE